VLQKVERGAAFDGLDLLTRLLAPPAARAAEAFPTQSRCAEEAAAAGEVIHLRRSATGDDEAELDDGGLGGGADGGGPADDGGARADALATQLASLGLRDRGAAADAGAALARAGIQPSRELLG
jgi:hypothetical protein